SIRAMYVGGSAVPQALIEAFEKRYGLRIYQAWGMTEMAPLGTVAQCPPAMNDASDAVRLPRDAGTAGAVCRDPRAQRRRARPLGWQDHGRTRGARAVDCPRVLQPARFRRPVHR